MRADVMAEKLGEEHGEKAGEYGTQQEEQQLSEEAGERPFFLGQRMQLLVRPLLSFPRVGGGPSLSAAIRQKHLGPRLRGGSTAI